MNMKIKNIVFALMIACFLTGCSPIDKVKWSKVNILGNDIFVWRIINGIAENSGTVTWSTRGAKQGGDIVYASITRKDAVFLLCFRYYHDIGKCELVEYRKNGEPQSPLFIYGFLK